MRAPGGRSLGRLGRIDGGGDEQIDGVFAQIADHQVIGRVGVYDQAEIDGASQHGLLHGGGCAVPQRHFDARLGLQKRRQEFGHEISAQRFVAADDERAFAAAFEPTDARLRVVQPGQDVLRALLQLFPGARRDDTVVVADQQRGAEDLFQRLHRR